MSQDSCSCSFPIMLSCGSAGKESASNAGDLGSIPGLRRSPAEGIGYLLQCSWASLVAQLVKNPPTMWETWVGSPCWIIQHLFANLHICFGIPCGSEGKESVCNVRDLGLIPWSGRSLEKGMATHSSILAWRIS